jgi:hypothetical protein
MMNPKGKHVAIMAGVLGLATITLTAFLSRDRIVEEWWLWKISRTKDDDESLRLLEQLCELRSPRTVPLIFERIRREGASGWQGLGYYSFLYRIGEPGTPELIRGLGDSSADVRSLSALTLEKLQGNETAELSP